jgi:hypothetical protein
MELDRVNFTLTMTVSHHPRRGETGTVVETFGCLQELLDRYDVIAAEDDRLRRQHNAPDDTCRLAEFPEGHGESEL